MPLRCGMAHWPGDPEVEIKRLLDMAKGAACNVSSLAMSVHTGTHMDAPRHFLRAGKGMDQMPLAATIGPARVIEIKDRESIKPAELVPHRPRRGERLLFKTRNSLRSWKTGKFDERFVYISREAARFLAERRVAVVGIDYLSVGGYRRDSVETHEIVLGAGIWIIEGLDLAKVAAGNYDLVCLPLKIPDSDGAPARAILRRRG